MRSAWDFWCGTIGAAAFCHAPDVGRGGIGDRNTGCEGGRDLAATLLPDATTDVDAIEDQIRDQSVDAILMPSSGRTIGAVSTEFTARRPDDLNIAVITVYHARGRVGIGETSSICGSKRGERAANSTKPTNAGSTAGRSLPAHRDGVSCATCLAGASDEAVRTGLYPL